MDVEAIAVDSPMQWARNHSKQYLESDGSAIDHPLADSMILLYTMGRKSGEIRRIPIVALREDGGWYVMASMGGAPTHPSWYLNLSAEPNVWVRDKAELVAAEATTVSDADRPDVFDRFTARFPFFREYEEKTKGHRVIPVVRITPKA
jgi:deazaflavin-dependent oxidoreductase (nitroreductase family)